MSRLSQDEEAALGDAYAELLVAAARLLKGLIPAQRAPLLRDWAVGALRSNRSALMRSGLDERWIDAVQIPVVALLDEAARQTPEPGFPGAWSSLQFELYGHEDLGQQVFAELGRLRAAGSTPLPVLCVYQRCLAFGLQGQYQGHPRPLQEVATGLSGEIHRRQGPLPPMSPDLHPPRAPMGAPPSLGLHHIALCALAASALILLGLFALTRWEASATQGRIAEMNPLENIAIPGGRP